MPFGINSKILVVAVAMVVIYVALRQLRRYRAETAVQRAEDRLRNLVLELDGTSTDALKTLFEIWHAHRALPNERPLSDFLSDRLIVNNVKAVGQLLCDQRLSEMKAGCDLDGLEGYKYALSLKMCDDVDEAWSYVHDALGKTEDADEYEEIADGKTDFLSGLEYDIEFDRQVLEVRREIVTLMAEEAVNEYLNGNEDLAYHALMKCLDEMGQAELLPQAEIMEDGRNFLAICEEAKLRRAAKVLRDIDARSLAPEERQQKIRLLLNHYDVTLEDVGEALATLEDE
jgi:hypothetical protein